MYKDQNNLNTRGYDDDRKFRQPTDRPSASPSSLLNTSNQFGTPEEFIKDNLNLEYKTSFLGARLSELEETYKNQMNRQVLNSMANLYKKIVEEMKTDMDERFSRQGEEHMMMVERLKKDLKDDYNGKLVKQREEYLLLRDNLQSEVKADINARLMKQREEYLQLKENLHAQMRAELNHKMAKQTEDLLITKDNIMMQLRSEMNVKFIKQGEEIITTKEKLENKFKEELHEKIAIQNEEILVLKEDFQIQLQELNSNVTKMHEKVEMSLTKEMHGLKAKVFEMIDSSSEKFKTIWTNLDSLFNHLGIKINSNNGELTILRESIERYRGHGSPENSRLSHTASAFRQPQAEFLKDNLNRIADKLRIYREAIYAVTKNQSLTQSHWRIHQRELHLQGVPLEEACEQVVTMEELAMIVKAVILDHKREFAKLKDVVDENAVAQNDFNASIAGKLKDFESVTHFAQENFNSLSEDFNLFVAQESRNTEVGINKRENIRRDIDKLIFRVEELSDSYKQLTDPVALGRLQKLIWGPEKPEHVNRSSDQIIPEEIDERVGAMEFMMWRYARNFVEPEAMKRIAKITRVTVPVYEKLENLLFLIKNCGFIEPRTIRHAIRTFKDAIARLGRRCVKEKQDAFEEVWKLIQAQTELDTVYYYYLMEVFCSLLSEEKNNLDRAFELSVFEYLFELLRKKNSSQPAQTCMLKALFILCRTEVHLEFIQKTHLVPDILALCRPLLESYAKSIYSDHHYSPFSQIAEEKLHGAQFDSNDILEIDGMFVKTALVYYSLRLFSEIFRKAPLVQHSDLTFIIQSILKLLKRSILLHNIRELCLIVLHRIFINSQGKYMVILCLPECLDLLEINAEDPNLSKDARFASQELIIGLREATGSPVKHPTNFRTTTTGISSHARSKSVKVTKPGTTGSEYRTTSPTKLPHISHRNTATMERGLRPRIYERSDKLTEFLEMRPDLVGPEGSIYSKTRKERLSKARFVDSDYTTVISKTGLMTFVPKHPVKKSPSKVMKNAHSSSLYPTYTQPGDESFEEVMIRRSRDVSLDPTINRDRMFHSFIEGESRQDSEEEEQMYLQPKSVKTGSAGAKDKLGEIVKDVDGGKTGQTIRVMPATPVEKHNQGGNNNGDEKGK